MTTEDVRAIVQESEDRIMERIDGICQQHDQCVERCAKTRAPMYEQINTLREKVAGMSGRQVAVTMIIVGPLTGILASLLTIGMQRLLGW